MNKDSIYGFLVGLSVGGSIALLFAPRSGKKMRTQIAQATADGAAHVKQFGETVRDTTHGLVERGKEELTRQKDDVGQAARKGAEAYHEAVR
jgi:gas vesicle protein